MDENNKALENAANAMEEAAEAPAETPVEEAPKEETPVEEAPVEETTVEAKADDVEVKEEAVEIPNENAATEMKEEPAIETTPAEPVAEPVAPVIESTPAAAPADPAKKSKKGLIIGVAAGVVVAAGAAGGYLAYALDSKPENIAVSAFTDFISTKTMATSGVIELTLNDDGTQAKCSGSSTKCIEAQNRLESVKVEISNDKNSANEINTSATLKVVYGGEELSISLGSVVLKDYTIYAKIDGVKEAAKKALKLAGSSQFDDYVELYEDLIDAIAGEIDGVWWKIYIPDVIDAIDGVSASQKKQYKGLYQCTVEAADRAIKKQDKYAEFYKNNTFVSLSEYKGSEKPSAKGTPYTLKIDAKKFTAFANKAAKETVDEEYTDCIGKLYSSSYSSDESESEVPEIEENDVKKALEDFPEIIVTVENGFFSHKLTGIYYTDSNDSYSGKIDLKFSKEAKAVSAPSDSKNVTDLYENIMNAYEEWQETAVCKAMKLQYPTYYNTYCDAATNKPKPQYQTQLKRNSADSSIFDLL